MLFFQTLLLAGYAYAHLLVIGLKPRGQAAVHMLLLLLTLWWLPLDPVSYERPAGEESPAGFILLLLLQMIGLPYLVLSSTGPLIQRWYSLVEQEKSPYKLYALSNAGSLLALLSYPFVIEPALNVELQMQSWSFLFYGFLIFCGLSVIVTWKYGRQDNSHIEAVVQEEQISTSSRFTWFVLSATASILLLAITNHICQDVASIPFLWVIPLAIYLLSFILCFESTRWYKRGAYFPALLVLIWLFTLDSVTGVNAFVQVAVISGFLLLFVACMVCHGELERLKPGPGALTSFYLMISAGGAAGGIFVGLIAPSIFSAYYELFLGLLLCLLIISWFSLRDSNFFGGEISFQNSAILIAGIYLSYDVTVIAITEGSGWETQQRNFYGIVRTETRAGEKEHGEKIVLTHGRVVHGFQFLHESRQNEPTGYYGPESGVGLAMRWFQKKQTIRSGIVGLGAGTLAAYGGSGDFIKFYEINPLVIDIARERFSFLKNSPSETVVEEGDGRIVLEKEPAQNFNVFVVDAFSGDSIPVHLLTLEAFKLYQSHIDGAGVIAFHVSNLHLDLRPVVSRAGKYYGFEVIYLKHIPGEEEDGVHPSEWMLLTKNQEFISYLKKEQGNVEVNVDYKEIEPWTDSYSNMFKILKW